MKISTTIPAIPKPNVLLNRPVTFDGRQVGRVLSVVTDTKDPARMKVTAEVSDDLAPLLIARPDGLTIRGLVKQG